MPAGADVRLSNIQQEAAQNLTHKSHITLKRVDDDPAGLAWACCLDEDVIGYVPKESSQHISSTLGGRGDSQHADCVVRVRSIRREKESQQTIGIEIRVAASARDLGKQAACQSMEPLLVSPELEDLEKSGRIATRAHLTTLAQDTNIRKQLATRDMQAVIASIDADPVREAALAKAMENPAFAAFCGSILDRIPP